MEFVDKQFLAKVSVAAKAVFIVSYRGKWNFNALNLKPVSIGYIWCFVLGAQTQSTTLKMYSVANEVWNQIFSQQLNLKLLEQSLHNHTPVSLILFIAFFYLIVSVL